MKLPAIIFLVCFHYPGIEAQNNSTTNLFKSLSLLAVENALQDNRPAHPVSKAHSVQTIPSKAIFTILMEGDYGQVNSFEIYNMLGLCVFNSQIHSTRKNLDSIPQGVYLVRFITEDKIISEKITIGEVRSYPGRPSIVDVN